MILTLQETKKTYPTFRKGKSSSTPNMPWIQGDMLVFWRVWIHGSFIVSIQLGSIIPFIQQGKPRFWSLLKCDRSDHVRLSLSETLLRKKSLGDLVVVARLLEDFAWDLVSSINSFLFPFPRCPKTTSKHHTPSSWFSSGDNPTFAPATVRRRWWSISCRPLSTWHWVASLRGIS